MDGIHIIHNKNKQTLTKKKKKTLKITNTSIPNMKDLETVFHRRVNLTKYSLFSTSTNSTYTLWGRFNQSTVHRVCGLKMEFDKLIHLLLLSLWKYIDIKGKCPKQKFSMFCALSQTIKFWRKNVTRYSKRYRKTLATFSWFSTNTIQA